MPIPPNAEAAKPIVTQPAGMIGSADGELETALTTVEQQLAQLREALRERDAREIEARATDLHRALASAVHRFAGAARQGRLSVDMRRRLAHASGEVAAQRESLARATAALDRAIDVLWPGMQSASLYSAAGGADRVAGTGMVQA